ncbi:MAG: hypothetical protein ACOX9R_08545 [Armatimonadota bacterium]
MMTTIKGEHETMVNECVEAVANAMGEAVESANVVWMIIMSKYDNEFGNVPPRLVEYMSKAMDLAFADPWNLRGMTAAKEKAEPPHDDIERDSIDLIWHQSMKWTSASLKSYAMMHDVHYDLVAQLAESDPTKLAKLQKELSKAAHAARAQLQGVQALRQLLAQSCNSG